MSSDLIRWLHLSDFHVGKDDRAQEKMFDCVLENVREKVESGLAPQMVCVTGDIANEGKAEEYEKFNDKFLTRLRKALEGHCHDRIFVVPGNHDVQRKESRATNPHKILSELPEFLDVSPEAHKDRSVLFPRFSNFTGFDVSGQSRGTHWITTESGALVHTFDFNVLKIGVLLLHTVWLSKNDQDRHKLSPGLDMLEVGLEGLNKCDIRFVLGHHPLDWFIEDEVETFRTLFGKNRVIYLHGHMHKNQTRLECKGRENFLSIQSGPCFATRDSYLRPSGYLWAALDMANNRVLMEPLRWSKDYREWKIDVDAFANSEKVEDCPPWCCFVPAPWLGSQKVDPEPVDRPPADPGSSHSPQSAYPQIWNLPHEKNPYFAGREELKLLEISLQRKQPVALTSTPGAAAGNCLGIGLNRPGPRQALVGLGGVGKTGLAVEYAFKHKEDYRVIWWINAEQPIKIDAAYSELAEKIREMEHVTATSGEKRRDIVRAWLERNKEWLLIFDNVKNPQDIKAYMPPIVQGHVIITSRNPHWGTKVPTIPVDVLPRVAATQFLVQRSGINDPEAAASLAKELGYLALALEQAAAYVAATGCGLRGYIERFKKSQNLMLKSLPESGEDTPTVAGTWKASFDEIRKESPAAADLLKLVSYFSPDDIPREMLEQGAESLESESTPNFRRKRSFDEEEKPDQGDEQGNTRESSRDESVDYCSASLAQTIKHDVAFDTIIALIRRYSLIDVDALKRSYSVHRLVQAVTRQSLSGEEREKWARYALGVVKSSFHFDKDEPWQSSNSGMYIPHALTVTTLAAELDVASSAIDGLLESTGRISARDKNLDAAQIAWERAIAIREKVYGPQHTEVADALAELGDVLKERADYGNAKKYYERAKEIYKSKEGPNGREVARVSVQIGWVESDLAAYEPMKGNFELALGIVQEHFSSDEQALSVCYSGMGNALSGLRDYEGATLYYDRAVQTAERIVADEPHELALRLSGRGGFFQGIGDLAGAFQDYRRALDIGEKVHGKEHPHVATHLNNLGLVYQDLGDLKKAEELIARAMDIEEKVFGKEHPEVAIRLNNLGSVYQDLGDLKKAKELIARALDIGEKVYENTHPHVAIYLYRLASVLERLEKTGDAEKKVRSSIEILEKTLGKRHYRFATALVILGKIMRRVGDNGNAGNALEQAVEIRRSHYGPESFRTAEALSYLGLTLADLGEEEEGRRLCSDALRICEKSLGPDHFKTRELRNNLELLHV